MRSRASSFKWKYPLLSLRSSSSFLRFLPRLAVTFIPPFIFHSITRCRRQFLRKMWPIQLAFRFLISCRIFLCSLTLSNTPIGIGIGIGIGPQIFNLDARWGWVHGQLYLKLKSQRYWLDRRLNETHTLPGYFGGEKCILRLSGTATQFLGHGIGKTVSKRTQDTVNLLCSIALQSIEPNQRNSKNQNSTSEAVRRSSGWQISCHVQQNMFFKSV